MYVRRPLRVLSRAGQRAATVVLLAATACVLAACQERTRAPASNVVLVSIDTLRADHLGCYGYPRDTTPALDRLASRGVVFSDTTSVSPWTLPSHASLLTGRFPAHHGVRLLTRRIPDDVPTLATLLSEAGYTTRAVVNSVLVGRRHGFAQGFAGFDQVPEFGARAGESQRVINAGSKVTDTAIRWLAERDASRPFFLFVHYYDAHTDLEPEPEYRALFAQAYSGPVDGTTQQLVLRRDSGEPLAPEDVAHLRDLYAAELRQLDAHLERLFAALETGGLLDSTLVVVTSDHGEEFQEHGSLLHGRTHYQEMLAVPLLLAGPGVPAGRRVDTPVSLVDVAPTLLGLVGLEAPVGMDGLDLSRVWRRGEPLPAVRELFSEADQHPLRPDDLRMIRRGGYKLIHRLSTGESQLYDLANDPGELRDVSEQQPALVRELLAGVSRLRAGEIEGAEIVHSLEADLELLREAGYVQ